MHEVWCDKAVGVIKPIAKLPHSCCIVSTAGQQADDRMHSKMAFWLQHETAT